MLNQSMKEMARPPAEVEGVVKSYNYDPSQLANDEDDAEAPTIAAHDVHDFKEDTVVKTW